MFKYLCKFEIKETTSLLSKIVESMIILNDLTTYYFP